MKILLLGKNGQIGWELQRSLAPLGEIVALGRQSADLCGDLSNLQGLAATVQQVCPDVIVNAAAHTAVDKAESEPELVRTLNTLAPEVLAREAEKIGALLVHYSTDYVFDGSGDRPWKETDTPAPLNVYGKTKLEGERLIQSSCAEHLIFRTSWVYSDRGNNFPKTMLRLAAEGGLLTIVDDQIGAPTGAELIADITAHAVHQVLGTKSSFGLYHLVADGETSWHRYAQYVLSKAGAARPGSTIGATHVAAVPSSALPAKARRPLNSRLDTAKLQAAFDVNLPDWKDGVARMLAETL